MTSPGGPRILKMIEFTDYLFGGGDQYDEIVTYNSGIPHVRWTNLRALVFRDTLDSHHAVRLLGKRMISVTLLSVVGSRDEQPANEVPQG